PRSGHADLCLVTFPIAKATGDPPQRITEEILAEMGEDDRWTLSASGGYLNCNFDQGEFIRQGLDHIGSDLDAFGKGKEKDTDIIVEHTSANPNGPFHVGRARNPMIGDTLVRLFRFAGYRVKAQYWVNDMGKQVMILVWGLKNLDASLLPKPGRNKTDHDLVRYYQEANERLENSPSIEKEINTLLKDYEEAVARKDWSLRISKGETPLIRAEDVRSACERVLEGMTSSLSRLNVNLDEFVYESRVVEDGSLVDVIEGLKKSALCREDKGAFYLDLSSEIKGGDDDRYKRRFVFTRSDGSALYTTRDLAYHRWKLAKCTEAVNVLGEDHKYQSMMLSLALRELGSKRYPEIVFYSFVSLPQGKMSTRRNRVVFLDDLLDEAVERAREEVLKRRDDLSEAELDSISEAVGIGALRFNMVKVQPEKKMVFRWEDALSFEGSSAPFVQYSHARACSILRKLDVQEIEPDWSKLREGSEMGLVKKLLEFPGTMEAAASERKVHLVPLYLVELASAFNEFYRDCPVLSDKDHGRKSARVFLVKAVRHVLETGLDVLGIEAPGTM
ncbi:MAG: arginine--tRNA ligase, partial [Candidatus Thermoplasmatota archaeon]|nr:arginine--tRNA ligase [Candidatus Thermoplasmatota archaeon]